MSAGLRGEADSRRGGRRVVVVTGASGFVGRHLCRSLSAAGWEVRGLVRDPAAFSETAPGCEPYGCELPDRVDPAAFRGAAVVVHAAWATRLRDPAMARRVNEDGTRSIQAHAREVGVDSFIFVSSTSAHRDALSGYGRSKYLVEQGLDLSRDTIVCPGLVLGRDGGLFARIADTLRRTPIVPLIDGGRQAIQTVHIDDICAAIRRVMERELTGRFVVAEPLPLTMRGLFELTAKALGRTRLFVPVPSGLLLQALRLAELARLPLPVSSENLLGARSLRVVPSAHDIENLGVSIRAARESIADLFGAAEMDKSLSK